MLGKLTLKRITLIRELNLLKDFEKADRQMQKKFQELEKTETETVKSLERSKAAAEAKSADLAKASSSLDNVLQEFKKLVRTQKPEVAAILEKVRLRIVCHE